MAKNNKAFKDTDFGKFLNKAKDVLPEVGNIAVSLVSGNYVGAVKEVGSMIKKGAEKKEEAKVLLQEFEQFKMEYEKECFELEALDRDSARNREVEMKKAGAFDFMMLATGIVGLLSFAFVIYAVVYIPSIKDNDLFVHLMGMIEGVVIGNIFAYYYGTSVTK